MDMRNLGGAAAVLSATIACGGSQALRRPPAPDAPPATSREPATPVAPTPATPGTAADASSREASTPETSLAALPDFARDVKPLLARTCTPCHVPGGKMYDRLPFDDAKTVVSAQAGILRRLKGDDHDLVARWIASQTDAR